MSNQEQARMLANLPNMRLLAKRDEITSRIATYRQPGQPVRSEDLDELGEVMAEINRREGVVELHAQALGATTSRCTCRGIYLGGNYSGAHLPGCPDLDGKRGLTEDEAAVMGHCRHFGSDGYGAYVTKCGKEWTWGTDRVAGPPVVFKTRREAVASFEAFLDILRDALVGEDLAVL